MIINMLRESLQIDRICSLIQIIGGTPNDPDDDLIGDDELYHRYVDIVADDSININDLASVQRAVRASSESMVSKIPNAQKKLAGVLEVMLYAHAASMMQSRAEQILYSLS